MVNEFDAPELGLSPLHYKASFRSDCGAVSECEIEKFQVFFKEKLMNGNNTSLLGIESKQHHLSWL